MFCDIDGKLEFVLLSIPYEHLEQVDSLVMFLSSSTKGDLGSFEELFDGIYDCT
jgi:hypothetical protein